MEKVAVIVAAYNAEQCIQRCLDSLLAMTYPDFDIIVVDNNSSDGTADIVKQYADRFSNITYLLEVKKGWPAARNTGIAYACTSYVANIDADCFPAQNWLQIFMDAWKNLGSDVVCLVGRTLVEQGETFAQRYYACSDPFGISHKIGKTEFVPWGGGNNMMRREAFLKAKGYDSDRFVSGADVEFHHRWKNEFGFETRYLPEAIIYHRARGSARELFEVASKYAYDGFLRSREGKMESTRNYYRLFLVKKLYGLCLHIIGLGIRLLAVLLGQKTWWDVAQKWFSLVSLSGTIFGYCKGRVKTCIKGFG